MSQACNFRLSEERWKQKYHYVDNSLGYVTRPSHENTKIKFPTPMCTCNTLFEGFAKANKNGLYTKAFGVHDL